MKSREELIRSIVVGFNPQSISEEHIFTKVAGETYDAATEQMRAELAREKEKAKALVEALEKYAEGEK